MSKKLRTEAVDHLFDAILSLENREECYTFFEDVCTVNELLSLSQRFEVARMLRDQKTYLDIAEKTGASTATISRVNRSLNYGNDGYDMVFSRMAKGEEKQEQKKYGLKIKKEGLSQKAGFIQYADIKSMVYCWILYALCFRRQSLFIFCYRLKSHYLTSGPQSVQ